VPFSRFYKFFSDEWGAITVDWVVLTAIAISISVPTYKFFIVGQNDAQMAVLIAGGEVQNVFFTGQSNGMSKIVATAQWHAAMFVKCIFNPNTAIEADGGLNDAAACRYVIG
jgi:hypothetical protein